jgi:mannose-1-phosphate guanylyltransferase/mannose-6-phosphate isomerase
LVPAERVIVVATRARAGQVLLGSEAAGARLFCQPADRGTATEILLPALWILCHEPEATIVVFRPGPLVPDARLLAALGNVAAVVEQHPLWVVLLGAVAKRAATEYGWIEPGECLAQAGALSVFAVRQFLEKPRAAVACACLAAGWLWNTFVLVAKASVLVEAARLSP